MPSPGDAPTRLFFAIMPDPGVRTRLTELAATTAHATGGRARAAETLHLTVVFVGSVAADAVEAIRDAGAATRWEAHDLALDRLGSFARAGIGWAAPSRTPDALMRMHRDLVQALLARGVEPEARPYRPHVTLVRRCTAPVDAPIEPPIAWRVDALVLMSSRLLSDGSRYAPIAHWPAR